MNSLPFRFRKLGYTALTVSDLDRSIAFYRDVLGLKLVECRAKEFAFFSCTRDHHNLMLYHGAEPGLRRLGFEMESARDWEAARDHLCHLGINVVLLPQAQSQELGISQALRFSLPGSQAVIELYQGMQQRNEDFVPGVAKILRLGHTVIASSDADTTVKWLTEHFNFRVSDEVDGVITFLRCFPNPYHHSLGIARGPVDQLHHVAFMVSEIDDIGSAVNRLRKANVKVVFGPGRHVPSLSVFLYFLDPDGMTIEYTLGMEEFPELAPREGRKLPRGLNTLDMWGGAPAPEYAKTGRIESALS